MRGYRWYTQTSMPAVSVHKPHGTRLNVGTPLSPSPSPASGRGEQGRTTCRWLLPSYANPVCALAGKAKLPARRGLWHENGLQDPSGGQFGFFVTPLSASNANTPPSLRRKPQSSGAFDGDGALFWTPAFAGVTADGACGTKMACKAHLAGSLAFPISAQAGCGVGAYPKPNRSRQPLLPSASPPSAITSAKAAVQHSAPSLSTAPLHCGFRRNGGGFMRLSFQPTHHPTNKKSCRSSSLIPKRMPGQHGPPAPLTA